MSATHTHARTLERLRFIEYTGHGKIAIFENIDCPYLCRTTCPNTIDFVIPYASRTVIVEDDRHMAMVRAYRSLLAGDGGESMWPHSNDNPVRVDVFA